MISVLPAGFADLLTSCSLSEKRAMLLALKNSIDYECAEKSKSNVKVDQYVTVIKNFVPSDNFDEGIRAEVESMGLLNKSNSAQTQWLSKDSRDYCFSYKEKLKHTPKPISQYPNIYI